MGGVILLSFLIYHLLHLTLNVEMTGALAACPDGNECTNVYRNVVTGFSHPESLSFTSSHRCFLGCI